MNKLGQSEEKTSEAEAKREDIPKSDEKPSEVKSLPKFGFIPTAKPKTDEKNDTTKEETDKTKTTVGPKFGFVASVPKDEKSEEKGKEETKTESTTTTKPKFGFFNPQAGSTDNKPKPLQFNFLQKSSESSGEDKKLEFKSTASTWAPVKMGFQFGQKSAFSSTIASESSTPKLNIEKKEKVSIPEDIQQQTTGEENENVLFSGICMLYIFDGENKNWKDKGGKATIHINCRKDDKSKSRILIRNFYSKRILMNSSIFQKMKIMVNENQPNSVRFTALNEEEVEDPKEKKVEKKIELRVYMLRFKEKSEAEEAKKILEDCIKNCTDTTKDSSSSEKNDDEQKSKETTSTEKEKSDDEQKRDEPSSTEKEKIDDEQKSKEATSTEKE